MLRLILLVIIALIGALAAIAATRPNRFRIERRILIGAPPERIFAVLNDLRTGPQWSPFEQADPQMQRRFSGPETGPGAVYEWSGNKQAGAGRLEISETHPPYRLVQPIQFYRPFKANNIVEYILTPQGDATEVTWAMSGTNNFTGKLVDLVFNCDKMVGKQFETGLNNLKRLIETQNPA